MNCVDNGFHRIYVGTFPVSQYTVHTFLSLMLFFVLVGVVSLKMRTPATKAVNTQKNKSLRNKKESKKLKNNNGAYYM